jgi:LysR family transcriptional regulator, carnitine catabolism transcriptional activator
LSDKKASQALCQVTAMVREERADFGLSVAPNHTEDLEFTPILDDHNVVVCPLGHPLLLLEQVPWRRLSASPFLGGSSVVGHAESNVQPDR